MTQSNEDVELITDPADIVLHSRCSPVVGKETWEKVRHLAKEMTRVMKEHKGIGLAAPQVGMSLKIAVLYDKSVLVNPRLEQACGHRKKLVEGCLSIPGKQYLVERFTEVKVTYQDQDGHMQFEHCTGLDAQVLQHEIDHLNGRLISDHGELYK